jgi:hypothetical protein
MRLIKVVWEDACELDGSPWVFNTEEEFADSCVVIQVGFVLEDNEKHVVLTHSYTKDQVARRNLIPKGMITEIIELGDH